MVAEGSDIHGSSVVRMGYRSDDERQEPDDHADSPLRRGEVARAIRDVEASEYAIDGPVVVGPGSPPGDGSCGQFAVQFHATTTMVAGLKRIADARGVSVPELCRQVIGVFVAQQEGELGALLDDEVVVLDGHVDEAAREQRGVLDATRGIEDVQAHAEADLRG